MDGSRKGPDRTPSQERLAGAAASSGTAASEPDKKAKDFAIRGLRALAGFAKKLEVTYANIEVGWTMTPSQDWPTTEIWNTTCKRCLSK